MKYTIYSLVAFFTSAILFCFVITGRLHGVPFVLLCIPLSLYSVYMIIKANKEERSNLFIKTLLIFLNMPIILYTGLYFLLLFYFSGHAI